MERSLSYSTICYKQTANIINDSIQLNSFLQSYGITKEDLFIDKHAIFCLTPFSLDGLEVFKVVREVCSSKSYRAFRGDEKYIPGDIFSEIIRYIIHSRLIIADLNWEKSKCVL